MGCILYELLTLRHPFDGSSIIISIKLWFNRKLALKTLMRRIMYEDYDPISTEYSEELRGLIADMLKKDPGARPTIKEILQRRFVAVSDLTVNILS